MREADQALSKYISHVKSIPALSREDEHDLAVLWRDKQDPKAAEKLVRANLRYVVAIALTYRRYGLRIGDLVAEGNVGVVTALRKFDPDKGTRFVTYAAYWIRAYILNYVIRSWSLVGRASAPAPRRMAGSPPPRAAARRTARGSRGSARARCVRSCSSSSGASVRASPIS